MSRAESGCPMAPAGRRLIHWPVEEHRDGLDVRLRIMEESALKAVEIGGGVLVW